VGAVVYTYVDHRLLQLAASDVFDGLPAVVRAPLSQPLFILGAFFVLVVYFAPTGITGVGRRIVRRGEA
jgi:branched-chain amino acid transport system permease protein